MLFLFFQIFAHDRLFSNLQVKIKYRLCSTCANLIPFLDRSVRPLPNNLNFLNIQILQITYFLFLSCSLYFHFFFWYFRFVIKHWSHTDDIHDFIGECTISISFLLGNKCSFPFCYFCCRLLGKTVSWHFFYFVVWLNCKSELSRPIRWLKSNFKKEI